MSIHSLPNKSRAAIAANQTAATGHHFPSMANPFSPSSLFCKTVDCCRNRPAGEIFENRLFSQEIVVIASFINTGLSFIPRSPTLAVWSLVHSTFINTSILKLE